MATTYHKAHHLLRKVPGSTVLGILGLLAYAVGCRRAADRLGERALLLCLLS